MFIEKRHFMLEELFCNNLTKNLHKNATYITIIITITTIITIVTT